MTKAGKLKKEIEELEQQCEEKRKEIRKNLKCEENTAEILRSIFVFKKDYLISSMNITNMPGNSIMLVTLIFEDDNELVLSVGIQNVKEL